MRSLLSILFAGLAGAASAGDSATFGIIGFSDEYPAFAYEEFSIGDEGTLPYAAVSILSLDSGRIGGGQPFTAVADEDEDTTIEGLRAEARELAGHALSSSVIDQPGKFLAMIGDGVRDEGKELTFGLPLGSNWEDLSGDVILRLTEEEVPPGDCNQTDEIPVVSYRLEVIVEDNVREIGSGEGLPCARAFRIYGVVQPYNGGDLNSLVAIVSVYTWGFEGYDRRFIAVPLSPRHPAT